MKLIASALALIATQCQAIRIGSTVTDERSDLSEKYITKLDTDCSGSVSSGEYKNFTDELESDDISSELSLILDQNAPWGDYDMYL